MKTLVNGIYFLGFVASYNGIYLLGDMEFRSASSKRERRIPAVSRGFSAALDTRMRGR